MSGRPWPGILDMFSPQTLLHEIEDVGGTRDSAWNSMKHPKILFGLGILIFLQKIENYSFFPRFNPKPQLLPLRSLLTFIRSS